MFSARTSRLPYVNGGTSGSSLLYEAELLSEGDPLTLFLALSDWLGAGKGGVRIRPLLLDDELDPEVRG